MHVATSLNSDGVAAEHDLDVTEASMTLEVAEVVRQTRDSNDWTRSSRCLLASHGRPSSPSSSHVHRIDTRQPDDATSVVSSMGRTPQSRKTRCNSYHPRNESIEQVPT